MICRADLHTHSTASDGQYTPADLARRAWARGIEVWALTDHDSLDGLDEAAETGRALGMQTVRGVELSAEDYPNLHILGYAFPAGSPVLEKMTAELKAGRNDRKYRIRDFCAQRAWISRWTRWTRPPAAGWSAVPILLRLCCGVVMWPAAGRRLTAIWTRRNFGISKRGASPAPRCAWSASRQPAEKPLWPTPIKSHCAGKPWKNWCCGSGNVDWTPWNAIIRSTRRSKQPTMSGLPENLRCMLPEAAISTEKTISPIIRWPPGNWSWIGCWRRAGLDNGGA